MTSAIKELEELVLGSSLGKVKINDAWRINGADCYLPGRHLSGIVVEKGMNVPINFLGHLPSAKVQSLYTLNGTPENVLRRGMAVVGIAAPEKHCISILTEDAASALLSELQKLDGETPNAVFGDAVDFLSPRSLWVKRVFTHLGGSNDYVAVSLRYDAQREVVAVRLPAQVIQPLLQG